MTSTQERKKRLIKERQSRYRKKHKMQHRSNVNLLNGQQYIGLKRHELERMDQICIHCGAKFWIKEKDHNSSQTFPTFAICCAGGKVSLPPLFKPPSYLLDLYTSLSSNANSFRKNIRGYNNLLACTSFGADIDERFRGQGVSNFRIHGQIYHLIGSLLPEDGHSPMFAQLYIYDTENEVRHRMEASTSKEKKPQLDEGIVSGLLEMLDEHNELVKSFRMARDRFKESGLENVKLRLIGIRSTDGRQYNLPTTSELAALIVGE